MALTAALIYWVIVAIWLAVLATVVVAFFRNEDIFGTTRLLLAVVSIDIVRNLVENTYFGLYFGSRYGLLPAGFSEVLGRPELLILPKVLNVVAACVVLGLLLLRWLPMAARERRAAELAFLTQSDALRREIEEQRLLFEMSADLIMVVDRSGVIRRVSRSCTAILGYEPRELIGQESVSFAEPGSTVRVLQVVRELPRKKTIEDIAVDLRHRDGSVVKIAFSAVWASELDCALVIGRDVTDRYRAAEQLDRLAHFDQLSLLPNRISLMRDLAADLEGVQGSDPIAAIAVFDLDGFKDINDLLGHATGDHVVREVGARLLALASAECRFYRSGGDEFFLLMPDCASAEAASRMAWTVIRSLEERLDVDDYRLFISVSAGVAHAPEHGTTPADLILNADLALHHAKSGDGRKVCLFEPPMRVQARARQEIDSELRRAVAEGELVLHFQPQIRLSDGAVVGAEALLRWNHPERGLLVPAAFIEALGGSPAAPEAGHFVLTSACMAAASWRAGGLGALRIGVNLFPIQFRSRTLLEDVSTAISASGIGPEQLELEITENIALGHDEEVLATLNGLRAQGIGIAFDDFGTGYASLSYLMRYPLSRLKIDRSFVQKIAEESQSEDTAIVQSIIVMAHNIGLQVVAEGVETEAQAAFLTARQCEEAQGYLFAKPLPQPEFEAFVRSRAGLRCNGAAR